MPHHCLQIPEILLSVFQYSVVDGQTDHGSLASFARTCSHFYEPAMEILWYTLSDVGALFTCLPDGVWYREAESDDKEPTRETMTLALARSLDPTEWALVTKNVHRVRTLDFEVGVVNGRLKHRVGPIALQEVMKYCDSKRGPDPEQPTVLFPNVTKLHWIWERIDPVWVPFIVYLSGHSLRELSIAIYRPPAVPESPQILRQFLVELPHRYPLLESLHLPHFYMGWLQLSDIASQLLLTCHKLQRVELARTLEQETFQCTGRMPNLTYLRAILPSTLFRQPSDAKPAGPPLFPSLTDVVFQAPNFDPCSAFIRRITSTSLRSVTIACSESSLSRDTIRAFFGLLQKHKQIRDVCLNLNNMNTRGSRAFDLPVIPQTIHPLLVLPGITHLKISPCCGLRIDIDDELIQSISTSWPNLESLVFAYDQPSLGKPQITLAGLLPLAKSCPHLTHLSLAVDFAVPDAFDQRQAAALRQKRENVLKQFDIYWWTSPPMPSSGLDVCVWFLLAMFPRIYTGMRVYGVGRVNGVAFRGWKLLESNVIEKGFSMRRRQLRW